MYDEDNTKEEIDGKKEKIKRDERRKSNKWFSIFW
jgi:hypothetical protein